MNIDKINQDIMQPQKIANKVRYFSMLIVFLVIVGFRDDIFDWFDVYFFWF